MQNVVVEPILVVPETDSLSAHVVHCLRDVNKMLEKFAGDILVSRIVLRKFHGNRKHVEAEHRHPARSVGLLHETARRKSRGAVENADVVEAEKTAFENVLAFRVFSIHPPGKIDHQLVKHADQKLP